VGRLREICIRPARHLRNAGSTRRTDGDGEAKETGARPCSTDFVRLQQLLLSLGRRRIETACAGELRLLNVFQ
ncbi:hypothetical protein ACIPIA_07125, partial [Bosea sp. CER48]|uniref:hypothetical protein n=1 Tax=Bosea sp. CER48 TaxID=3377035 RepID=UPI0037F28821